MIRVFLIISFVFIHEFGLGQDRKTLDEGKHLFRVHCTRCHGMLGGGGTGPSLQRAYLPRASSDEKLGSVISGGIAGTGMPANWMLEGPDVKKLIEYVRSLGQGQEIVATGDPSIGRTLFQKSICSTCHIVSGEGGSVGPELTQIGLKRGPDYLGEAIKHPGKQKPVDEKGFYKFLVVQVTLSDGNTLEGVRVNEDTFTIQIKDASNQFYSFKKSEVRSVKKIKEESMMPSFADQFDANEINDLVAYLNSLR